MKNQLTICRLLPLLILTILIGCNKTEKRWNETMSSNTIDSYDSFILEYPESNYADSAKRKIIELSYAKTIILNTLEGFESFLNMYPSSNQAVEAKTQHEKLLWLKANNENTIDSYEKYLTTYSNGSFGTEIKVDFSSEWFSVLIPCKYDLAPISWYSMNITKNSLAILKSLSISGPRATRLRANDKWITLPDPEKGSTTVSGGLQTAEGTVVKNAIFNDWSFIYLDSTFSSPIGWAIGLISGELVLPTHFFKNGPKDKYIHNRFEISEYCNDYVVIQLNPNKNHKVYLEWPDNGFPYLTINYPGTVIHIKDRTFTRRSDGWYFSINKE